MTKNNLKQSLAWLLQYQYPSHHQLEHTNVLVNSQPFDSDHGEVYHEEEMARLQLPPQSTSKSRLLSHGNNTERLPTTTVTGPIFDQPVSSNTPSKPRKTPVTPANVLQIIPKTPASAFDDSVFDEADVVDIDDFEEFDLTDNVTSSSFGDFGAPTQLWEEGAATRVEPVMVKRGKKRKSDEYREDLRSPGRKPPQPKRIDKGKSARRESVEFLDDDLFGSQSTLRRTSRGLSPKNQNLKQVVDTVDHKRFNAQPPKSPAKIVSIANSSESFASAQESIPDSDEEESWSPVKKSSSTPAKTAIQPSNVPDHPRVLDTPALKLSSSSNISGATVNAFKDTAETQSVPTIVSTPSQQRVKLTGPEKEVVKCFMKISVNKCEQFIARLNASRTANNEAIADELTEEGFISSHLTEKGNVIKQRLSAMRELMDQRNSFAEITTKREDMKKRFTILLDDGHDPNSLELNGEMAGLMSEIRKLNPRIDEQEVAMFHLLQLAGVSADGSEWINSQNSPERAPERTYGSGVLVASTQKSPVRRLEQYSAASPAHHHNYGTQSVIQTPIPVHTSIQPNNLTSYASYNTRSPDHERMLSRSAMAPSTSLNDFDLSHWSSVPAAVNEVVPNFGTRMGSAPPVDFIDDEFDDMNDDLDLLDVAERFERNQNHIQPTRKPEKSARPPLSDLSDNIRRTNKDDVNLSKAKPALEQHRWSKDVLTALRKRFHLQGFRHNQLEAINATLAGKDAFVLMPTGGGKSLCYQLPSIIQSGHTKGVTVVISPLLSLMQDQVDHLRRLKLQAFMINSECTKEHREMVFQTLRGPNVERFIQLLYITPEMLNKSQAINKIFRDLYSNRRLARIVIDEAHCVSQWGHDFRPDYKALGEVRKQFPEVPVMALTATATENVKKDVMHNLGMDSSEVFTQSFNRPNLTYEVRPKGKSDVVLASIADIIKTSYSGQSGIIYCLSRQNCEKVAEQLRKQYGIRASHYHAGMDSPERTDTQKKWQAGEYDVIVATIAFGMGIDKPDVRFVIHHTIPKSLEGYYQETGRAGRDGKLSGCYLYYGYTDTTSLKRMISKSEGSWEQKERQRQMLRNVVQFCENKADCRRVQVLAYFNEHFSQHDCNNGCDNCKSGSIFEMHDFTEHARNVIALIKQMDMAEVTLLHCVDVYRGHKNKKIAQMGHNELEQFGAGANFERGDVERLFYRLVSEDALEEFQKINGMGFATQYIKLGRRYHEFEQGRRKLQLHIRVSPTGKPKAQPMKQPKVSRKTGKSAGVKAPANEYPASTIVSSPLQPRSKQWGPRRNQITDSDDQLDEEEDLSYFEPVREVGVDRPSKKQKPGLPITTDARIARLDEAHRHILADFVEQARKRISRIVIEKSLRSRPVSDTVLREIAIAFPENKQQMLDISGMDEEKYGYYGPDLLRLIKNARDNYQAIRAAGSAESENHAEVVEIPDDEDEDEEEYEGDDLMQSDEDHDQSEHSHYFSAGDEVEDFNRKASQIQMLPTASKQAVFKKPSKGRSGSRNFKRGSSGSQNFRKKASTTSGVIKRKKTTSGSRASTSSAGGGSIAPKKGNNMRGSSAGQQEELIDFGEEQRFAFVLHGTFLDKPHHVAATTSTSSLRSLAVQSMLRTTTELGDVGQFAVRPSRVPRSTSRLPMKPLRTGSSESSLIHAPFSHRHEYSRPRRTSNRPRPATSLSGWSREEPTPTHQNSYHSGGRKSRYNPGPSPYGHYRSQNPAIRPRNLHSHRSLATLRGERGYYGGNTNSPMTHMQRRQPQWYRASSPAYSDVQPMLHNGRMRLYRPGSTSTFGSSPASIFPRHHALPGRYQDMNESYASLLRLPSPMVSFVNNPYQRSLGTSRHATPVSASFHNPRAVSTSSAISSRHIPKSATGSTAPAYYDYTESFVEEDCFSPDREEDLDLPPLNMNQAILQHGEPVSRKHAQTPFGAKEGSMFSPSELPTAHNRRPSEQSKHSFKGVIPTRLSSLGIISVQEKPGSPVEPFDNELTETAQNDADGDSRDPRRTSITSRRTTVSSLSGVFFPNTSRSPRNLPTLAARIHSPAVGIRDNLDKAEQPKQESMLANLTPDAKQVLRNSSRWEMPLSHFVSTSSVACGPVVPGRPKTSDDAPSRRSPEIYSPMPERPMSSQSRKRFSRILEIEDNYNSQYGKSSGLSWTISRRVTVKPLKKVEELTDCTSSDMQDQEAFRENESITGINDQIVSKNTCDIDHRNSEVASHDKSTIESLLDKHIECLGLQPENGSSDIDEDFGRLPDDLSTTESTVRLSELMTNIPVKVKCRPVTSSSCRHSSITIEERQKLKPRRLFASMDAKMPHTISNRVKQRLTRSSSSVESKTRLSYGWEPLPSSASLASPPFEFKQSVTSGELADIDSREKHSRFRMKRFSELSMSPSILSSPSDVVPKTNVDSRGLVRHRRSKSEVLARQESHRRRRMRIRLKLKTRSRTFNDLRQYGPCGLEANIEISEGSTQEYPKSNQSISIKSPVEGFAELSAESVALPTDNPRLRSNKSPPIPKRWSSIVAAMPEPVKKSAELGRKPSVRTIQTHRSNASIVEPLNSTRLNTHLPRLGDIPYIPPPEFGPPLTCSNLNLSIPYAEMPSTIQPTLRETKSFFSENSSAQRYGTSLRNKIRLHSLRSARPLSPKSVIPFDSIRKVEDSNIKLSHSCQMKDRQSYGDQHPSEADVVIPMSDFAYARHKMMSKVKDWWKRQCMQKLLKTSKRKEPKNLAGGLLV